MHHPLLSPARSPSFPRSAVLLAVLGLLFLTPVAVAIDEIGNIRDTVDYFQIQVDDRIAAIGEPATKAEKTELKCLQKASAILGDASDALEPLSVPEGLFETKILKLLAKVGGLIEKSGTTDPDVLLAFQAMFQAFDGWGDALDSIYDSYYPALPEKVAAKVAKLAGKAGDAYDQALDYVMNGEFGMATKTGAKALTIFAKAVAIARDNAVI